MGRRKSKPTIKWPKFKPRICVVCDDIMDSTHITYEGQDRHLECSDVIKVEDRKICVHCDEIIPKSDITSNNQKTHLECREEFTVQSLRRRTTEAYVRKSFPRIKEKAKQFNLEPDIWIEEKDGKLLAYPNPDMITLIHKGISHIKSAERLKTKKELLKKFKEANPYYTPERIKKAVKKEMLRRDREGPLEGPNAFG